ncbi:hypothetical protein HYH02_007963 [Chlamydomonas schloesseri]|uniref:LisH domain-containing protein n=1 Tax=Chlamydomonas schloesseri TaxID=2026947 RepID=A0A835WGR3_9CHLO|nr:hypothetical protein HYH02_007963 [Chlamydomonas schloesseri]|eukprot:KAG2447223.1 hypothetical protein HYH02_007963 [Chlamydomonas schloesseri]
MAEGLDPERLAQLMVLQWLHENGWHDALRAVEKATGRLYDDTSLPEASQLMQLLWRHVEEKLEEQELLEEEGEEGEADGDADGEGDHEPSASISAATGGTARRAGGGKRLSRAARRRRQEEALQLLRAGADDYAAEVVGCVPAELHRSNIIAVRLVPEAAGSAAAADGGCGRARVITAAGDGVVRCVALSRSAAGPGSGPGAAEGAAGGGEASDSEPDVVWEARVGGAALLCLALHPSYSAGLPLVAVGAMDGRVTVLHGPTGAVLASVQAHSKYVVRVAWAAADAASPDCATAASGAATASDGGSTATSSPSADRAGAAGPAGGLQPLLLASGSTDETVSVHRLDLDLDQAAAAVAAEAAAAAGDAEEELDEHVSPRRPRGKGRPAGGAPGGVDLASLQEVEAAGIGRLSLVKQVPYGATVTDVAFLGDGYRLAVACRSSNYLRLLDCRALLGAAAAGGGGGGGGVPEVLVNMNEAGDDHVSFTAKQLVPSPCGRYLLVCTDTPRLLVLRTSDWSVLRLVFGLPTDQFPQPAAAWHRDSNYIYAAGANAQLCVFHLGSGRLVHTARPHKINVRDIDYDPARNLLATCSFDKTVKLLGRPAVDV